MRKGYRLKKRENGYYYFMLPGMKGWKSTGVKSKDKAAKFITEKLQEKEQYKQTESITLREYAAPFFIWGTCPHCTRRDNDGQQISPEHAKHQRSILKRFILEDPIADKLIGEIITNDIENLKTRLKEKGTGDRTINSVLSVLKSIFSEGIYRDTLRYNPAAKVGKISYKKKESGTFTREELKKLFPGDSPGPWKDITAYTCFFVVATCGLRRGEVLALKWRHVSFENSEIAIEEAWKSTRRVDLPKWDKTRTVPLPEITKNALERHREESLQILPDDLVFCWDDGSRLGTNWWKRNFRHAMERVGIETGVRSLTPHSFRHTLNTLLRAQGYSDELIRAALGWTNIKTQAGYTHLNADHLRGQADIIDKFF